MFEFGQKNAKQTTRTQQHGETQTDPWDETIPYLRDLFSRVSTAGSGLGTPTEDWTKALTQLKDNASQGNPFAGDIGNLARDLSATPDRTPLVEGATADFKRRLAPVADGTNIDLNANPYVKQMLEQNATDVKDRINADFVAAGRDLSGYNQRAVGEGVSRATVPVLADLYKHETGRTDAAARDLFGGETGAASAMADMDRVRSALRTAGVEVSDAALAAQNWGPQQIMALEEYAKTAPVDELKQLADILFAGAKLGGQGTEDQTGTATTKGKQTNFGLKFDFGKALAAFA